MRKFTLITQVNFIANTSQMIALLDLDQSERRQFHDYAESVNLYHWKNRVGNNVYFEYGARCFKVKNG